MAYSDALRSSNWTGSDVADLIDELAIIPANIQTWTPSWAYDGTSVTGITLSDNDYVEFGNWVWFTLSATFTLTGNGRDLEFTLPVSSQNVGSVAAVGSSASSTTRALLGSLTNTTVLLRVFDATDWTAGVRSCKATGIYKVV